MPNYLGIHAMRISIMQCNASTSIYVHSLDVSPGHIHPHTYSP